MLRASATARPLAASRPAAAPATRRTVRLGDCNVDDAEKKTRCRRRRRFLHLAVDLCPCRGASKWPCLDLRITYDDACMSRVTYQTKTDPIPFPDSLSNSSQISVGSRSDCPPGRRRLGRRRRCCLCCCCFIFRACRGGHCRRRQGRFRQGQVQPRLCAQSEFEERKLKGVEAGGNARAWKDQRGGNLSTQPPPAKPRRTTKKKTHTPS